MAEEGAAKRLFDNLLTIEVNTLVKPGMTGRKMPAVGQALLDIFSEYDDWLCRYVGHLNVEWKTFPRSAVRIYATELQRQNKLDSSLIIKDHQPIGELAVTSFIDEEPVSADKFKGLRQRAATALEVHRLMTLSGAALQPGPALSPGAAIMLRRIIRNCDQLRAILKELAPADGSIELSRHAASGIATGDTTFSGHDVVTIRKAWELGTEVIVMQSVVQLDGDVLTRINDAYLSAEYQPLRDVHHEGVGTALEQWNSLVKTFAKIVDKLLKYLVG